MKHKLKKLIRWLPEKVRLETLFRKRGLKPAPVFVRYRDNSATRRR